MSQDQANPEPQEELGEFPLTFGEKVKEWFITEGAWWGASFVFHALLMVVLMLVGKTVGSRIIDDAPSIDSANIDEPITPDNLEKFEVGETPLENTELNTDTLTLKDAPKIEAADMANVAGVEMAGAATTSASAGSQLGGLGGFNIASLGGGPAVSKGGTGVGFGIGSAGGGAGGSGFGGRGGAVRKAMVGSFGGTKHSERAVAAALNWIARHQNPDGSWTIESYNRRCKDATCAGVGSVKADSAATALALLPFLAAGQTHESRGPYKSTIHSGLYWLMKNQKRDGSLWGTSSQKMYSHGLAAICLCEAYGLTGDKMIGQAAQLGVNFIQSSQHPRTGGWRYNPGDEGDTSVVGWMGMAMKSGLMAYLTVSPAAQSGLKHWLSLCAAGKNKGLYSYTPGSGISPSMTAVGLLLRQYEGMKPDDPSMKEGVSFIMSQKPDARRRALYYWYYATQVMHNIPGPDWDTWNRQMRRVLIETQIKEGCAAGSWDPMRPTRENLGESGGRLCVTSLSALTLEVYYRYLPLYKLDAESAVPEAVKAAAPAGAMDLATAAAASAGQKEKPGAAKPGTAEKKDAKPAGKPEVGAPSPFPAPGDEPKPKTKKTPKKTSKKT